MRSSGIERNHVFQVHPPKWYRLFANMTFSSIAQPNGSSIDKLTFNSILARSALGCIIVPFLLVALAPLALISQYLLALLTIALLGLLLVSCLYLWSTTVVALSLALPFSVLPRPQLTRCSAFLDISFVTALATPAHSLRMTY